MKAFEKVMYPVLFVILTWLVYMSRAHVHYFETEVISKGGIVSWGIFWTLLFASIMCFFRSRILKPFKRGKFFTNMLILQGLMFLFFAFDEISWFQNVWHFPTPKFFLERNAMGELNFHNLVVFGFKLSDVIFTLGIKILATLYFLVLPFFYGKLQTLKNSVNQYGIPLPRYTQVGAYAILSLIMLIIPSENRYIVFEFVFYWIIVLMMYNPLNDEIFSRVSLIR